MRDGTQLAMAIGVITAVLVLLLHPATPGVAAPIDGKQLKQIDGMLLSVCAALAIFAFRPQARLLPETQDVVYGRSPKRTAFCSLLC